MLYEKHLYLDRSVSFLINKEIIEYDIKSAGFNILKRNKLASPYTLTLLEGMEKMERSIYIGKLMKRDKYIKDKLTEGFVNVRKEFFLSNNIKDEEVLSIKKDAIFLYRYCENTQFENIEFIEKNKYTSYYYMNKKEFYYNSFTNILDVKGIHDSKVSLHQDYMLSALMTLFKIIEANDQDMFIRTIDKFSTLYKSRELNTEYYRQLDAESMFLVKRQHAYEDKIVFVEMVGDEYEDLIEISYNYMNYIVPLLSIMV